MGLVNEVLAQIFNCDKVMPVDTQAYRRLGRRPAMMKDGVVLLVIFLIVVGGIFALWTHGPAHSLSATVEQVPESSAALKTASTIAKSTPKPKPVRVTVAEEPAVLEAIDSPQVAAADPVGHAYPPPFPSVEEITTGLSEDSITGTYGDPALSAMTSTGGHTVETFVYARDGGGRATVVRLVDGSVFAVYSQSGSARAVGVSVPARRRKE
jgi:hypothetical protein